LDALDKEISSALYVASLSKEDPISIIRRKLPVNPDHLKSKIESLVKQGIVLR